MLFDTHVTNNPDSDSSTETISSNPPALRVEPYTPLAAMEGDSSNSANDVIHTSTSTPSTPHGNQENLGPKSSTLRALTKAELFERDRNAIAYSKSLLQEGDTLVFITYPANTQVFDPTGFQLISQDPFRVHSYKLLATGSSKFKELLSDWSQAKLKRRKRLFNGLPAGIQYILDLTPPDEGDEAVELTSELSCSLGIRHWYTAEQRCKVSAEVCGGKDEVAKPIKPKTVYKNYIDLADALTDELDSHINLVNDPRNYEIEVDKESDTDSAIYTAPLNGSRVEQLEAQQIQDAIQRSKLDTYNAHSASLSQPKDGYESVDQVPEYCPIRHRAGIERLLQLIEGKEPRLNSAPKVWTLFVLAKYFDCTNVVVDFIVSWVLREPNCQFIEILPEVTLKMGLGLKSSILTRPAFAILVSEHALSTISRECGSIEADKAGTNQFGRVREDIDEDTLSAIQAAAYSFISRAQGVLTELCDSQMAWLEKLPEYQKIDWIINWASNRSINADEKFLIKDKVETLKRELIHFVRGRILWGFNGEIWEDDNDQANKHRQAEAYTKDYKSDFATSMYYPMAEKEKMITKFAWKSLNSLTQQNHCGANVPLHLEGIEAWLVEKVHGIAKHHGVKKVMMLNLMKLQSLLNEEVLQFIQKYDFNFGHVPDECFQFPTTFQQHDDSYLEIGEEDKWGFPATTRSAQATPMSFPKAQAVPQDDFTLRPKNHLQDGTHIEKHYDFEFAASSPSGRGFQEHFERKEGDMLERLKSDNSSGSSTQPLLNLPLHTKKYMDNERLPLLEKRPNPVSSGVSQSVAFASGSSASRYSMINHVANVFNRPTAHLATAAAKPADPREQAIDLHNQAHFSTGTTLSPDRSLQTGPYIPTTPEKASPAHPIAKLVKAFDEPRVPHDDQIGYNSPFFSLKAFFDQVNTHVRQVAISMLTNADELDFTVLTDTLLCLSDDEWKYLPLWAGGNEDGSGGVFAPMIPPAPAGAGPSGPGPAFHTGYSMASRSGTEMDYDGISTIGESIDTSIAVENGYSDHVDRRRVLSEDDFHSEAFSDDTEEYVGMGNCAKFDPELETVGYISDDSEIYVGKGKGKAGVDDVPQSSTLTKFTSNDSEEDEWDGGDDEEAFDYGDEEDADDTMTV